MATIAIPFTTMTPRDTTFMSDALEIGDDDFGFGFALDRGVPDGANYKPETFNYTFQFQQSVDGVSWQNSLGGGTQYGGIVSVGTGTPEDPMLVWQWDTTTGGPVQHELGKFLRVIITISGLGSSEKFCFAGLLASGLTWDFQFGFDA